MKSIRFLHEGVVTVGDRPLPPPQKDQVRVKHSFSLISAGTETLKLKGYLCRLGDSPVGYSAVGEILSGAEGTGLTCGQMVFTHGRHEEIVDFPLSRAHATFIPISREFARQATFLQLGKVAMHGIHRVSFKIGDWVVVFGLGVVGNLAAQLALLSSGGRVIAMEPVQKRREIAQALGIMTLDPNEEGIVERIRDLTGGGPAAVLETSGHPHALALSFQIARERAQISLIAGHYGDRILDLKSDFQNKELTLIGARRIDLETRGSAADHWTVVEYCRAFYRMIETGAVQVDPLISHCVFPERAPEIYNRLSERDDDILGVLFNWTGDSAWNIG